jgi:integrase
LQAGRDLVGEKRAARAKALADKNRLTVKTAWRRYADAKISSGQWGTLHARNAEQFYSRVIHPVLGTRALESITRADWTRVITNIAGTGARAFALRIIRGFDNHAELSGAIAHAVLPRKAGGLAPSCTPRQHTPSDDDVIAIWHAAETLRPKARAFIRVLILTAARRGEVSGIREGEIDLASGLWRLPAGRAKNKTAHTMPLNALALTELKSIWPVTPVLPNFCLLGESGHSGLQDFSRIKARLDKAIGNSDWRTHDIRRSARTAMAKLGIASDNAEAALNHTSHRSALEKTYNTHRYQDEAVAALNVWQAHVERLLHPGTAEVVALRRTG